MKKIACFLSLFLCLLGTKAQQAGEPTIIDSRHYSTVFGEIRSYRIFLPPDYFENPQKSYPVIYYYHGWSQRYFGSTDHASIGIDQGSDNHGDNIANYVARHEVIVVKPDGYNRRPDEAYDLRPYNVSPVETYRQFPVYFPELVDHIDNTYRTIADRDQRAISGLSMGGFMSFWIGGKYPHLVSAAGNFCGSAEFRVGPRNAPVEYRHLDMYKNYQGMKVRLHYGDKDFIRAYHRDMNRVWTQVMDHYEYKIYDAAHSTCGLSDMFDFFMKTFKNPPGNPQRWHHTDVYPEFSVWDYQVSTDRFIPGFTILENVDKNGFRCAVREFLPDGELLPHVQVTVYTAPLYGKNLEYAIWDMDLSSGKTTRKTIQSDHSGRLRIELNGSLHEIGINSPEAPPNICVASFEIANRAWATPGKEVAVAVKLLNKGGKEAKGVKAELRPLRSSAKIIQGASVFGEMALGKSRNSQEPFTFLVPSDSIEMERFEVRITDESGKQWSEYMDIPLMTDRPEITDYEIADGRICQVMEAGDDTVSLFLGAGNGDGVPNPGESLVLLVRDQGKLWRTRLYSSDRFINPDGLHIRESDNWSSYDHVGGSAKYSVPVISSDCPENRIIEFFAEYWLPAYPDHIIKRGKISIQVSGADQTPPGVSWVEVSGDNTLHAKIYDGGQIQQVRAILRSVNSPDAHLKVSLEDQGVEGDRCKGDRVFSKKIPDQLFGLYHLEIEAVDVFGNRMKEKVPGEFVLH